MGRFCPHISTAANKKKTVIRALWSSAWAKVFQRSSEENQGDPWVSTGNRSETRNVALKVRSTLEHRKEQSRASCIWLESFLITVTCMMLKSCTRKRRKWYHAAWRHMVHERHARCPCRSACCRETWSAAVDCACACFSERVQCTRALWCLSYVRIPWYTGVSAIYEFAASNFVVGCPNYSKLPKTVLLKSRWPLSSRFCAFLSYCLIATKKKEKPHLGTQRWLRKGWSSIFLYLFLFRYKVKALITSNRNNFECW